MNSALWLPALYPREDETGAFLRNRKSGRLRLVGVFLTPAEAMTAAWAASDAMQLAHQTKRATGRRVR